MANDVDDADEECGDDDVDDDGDEEDDDFRYADESPGPEVDKIGGADVLNPDSESMLSKRWNQSASDKWGTIFGGRVPDQQRADEQNSSPYNLSVRDRHNSGGSSVVETSMTSSGGNEQPLPSPPVGFNMAAAASAMGAMFMLDSNLSPGSKIAILESAVYGLYQQQLVQLELIETLRRQLAVALATANSVTNGNGTKLNLSTDVHPDNASSPGDGDEQLPTGSGRSVAELTSSNMAINMADSSLSSLMRFSAAATADPRMALTSSETKWPTSLMQVGTGNSECGNRNQPLIGDEHESSTRHANKQPALPPGGSLAELSLFKKGNFAPIILIHLASVNIYS